MINIFKPCISLKSEKILGNSLAILLDDEILQSMDLRADDEVDITVENRILIISRLSENERKEKIENAVQDIFRRRKSAYQRLAEGV